MVDLDDLAAVCAAVVECYDRVLGGDSAVSRELDHAAVGCP